MSKMIEIDLRPDARTLRHFGYIAFVGFGVLAAMAWFEVAIFGFGLGEARPVVAGGLAGLGALCALLSLVHPKANLPVYLGMTILAYPIGFVLSYVIMGVLYFGLITPVALVFKLIGRDALQRRFEPEAETYWVPARRERPREHYFRQF